MYRKSVEKKKINRVAFPSEPQIIQDSSTFSDGLQERLTVEAALERQLLYAEKYGYADLVTHRASEDVLIDEKWEEEVRTKAGWTEQDAAYIVDVTVQSASYLARYRQCIMDPEIRSFIYIFQEKSSFRKLAMRAG